MSARQMDIVDAQVHLDFLYRDANLADPDQVLRAAVTAMDAIGVSAVVIVEGVPIQGERLANGAVRGHFRFSRRAVERFPRRFGYVAVVDAKDPDPEAAISATRSQGGAAIRLVLRDADDFARLADGALAPFFAAAHAHALPIFTPLVKEALDLLSPYLERFPELWVVLDHCGVGNPPRPDGHGPMFTATLAERINEVDRVLALARHPNLAVKWAHAPAKFSAEGYPYRDALQQLARFVGAYGAERLMWASDYTVTRKQQNWSESLHYIKDSDLLSADQKEWLFGKSVRCILSWPQA